LKNLVAFLIGLVFVLAGLEIGARALSTILGVSPYLIYDDTLGWVPQPNTTKIHKESDFEVLYTINSKGYRGKEYPLEKKEGVFRIVIIGDSMSFGYGVNDEETYAALIDKSIPNVEVINLSVSGYGTDQELLRLQKQGFDFKPDLVILQITDNDFIDIMRPFRYERAKPYFIIENENLVLKNVPVKNDNEYAKAYFSEVLPLPFREWLSWNSYAYVFINQKYLRLAESLHSRAKSKEAGYNLIKKPVQEYDPEAIKLFSAIVQKISKELNARGIQGIAFHCDKVLSETGVINNISLPLIDLYPAFTEKAKEVKLTLPDGHWNAEGHRFIVNQLIEVLRKRGILPESSHS